MVRILLIEDNPDLATLIRDALADARGGPFKVEWVRNLSDGLEHVRTEATAAVLLNLFLPDSQGIETFDALLLAAPYVPILVLSGMADEEIAMEAVRQGAKDYLFTDQLSPRSLTRAICKMIEYQTAEDALFLERERAQVTLDSIGDGVLSTDVAGNVTYLNQIAETMTGWSGKEAAGQPLAEVFRIIDAGTRKLAPNPMEIAVRKNKAGALTPNSVLIRRDGFEYAIEDSAAPIHDRGGRVTGAVIVFRDVTVARATALKTIHLAQHDFLTDLPNRMLLEDRVNQAIELARRNGKQLAVLFVDLDRFKNINDSLGHAVGDKVLQRVAEQLMACVRKSDTVSRHGGDEFIVLLSEIEHSEDAALSAKKLLTAVEKPRSISEHDLHLNASIGISIYPGDGRNAETLIQSADTALYHAKGNGRNNFQFFTPDMNARAVERQFLESSLSRALDRREFLLHYQPKVDLHTGATTGVEALIRWLHPERGLVPPAQFLPVAEDSGLILPIGQWILREACLQARAWIDAGLPPTPVAVNISAVEFGNQNFLEDVCGVLKDTGLDPRFLELELTESVLMQDVESTSSALRALKEMGVQLGIDDFGTGYSSLSYLRRFPIDTLKIDQWFVHEIPANADDAAIVCAIISMGRTLKKRVIAEGIEDRNQLVFLQSQGCGEGQGYYFGPPVPAAQFSFKGQIGI